MARKIRYGTTGVHAPPPATNTMAFQYYESAGYDFATLFDQLSLTVPRSIWTPDVVPAAAHTDIDCYMDPFPLMALAADATTTIELGLTSIDGLRRPPAELAKTFLTIDHISNGRSFFAVGAGEMKQFTPYGIERKRPFAHLEDTLRVIRLFWESDGPVHYDGPVHHLDGAVMALPPYEGRTPPLIVPGGPGRALEIAGRLGDGWLTYLPQCGDADWYGEQVATLRKLTEEAGRDPDEFRFIGAFITVAATDTAKVDQMTENLALRWNAAAMVPDDGAWRKAGATNPLGSNWSYARDLIPMAWSREDTLAIANQVPPEVVRAVNMCGTPDEVATQIQPYIDAGCNDVLIINLAALAATGDMGDAMGEYMGTMAQLVTHLRAGN
jgi:phthiodiolone/phenolphthiodiolone dimycocerosates ketoreductase